MTATGRFLTRLGRDRRGAAAMIIGLAAIPTAVAVGMAVDISRAFSVKQRLGAALDAAGLAAGSSTGSDAQLKTRFENYFYANTSLGAMGRVTDVKMTPDTVNNKLTVTATATVDTTIMRVIGQNTMTVSASAEITKETTGLEVALVLDNTGSMLSNNNIQAVRDAATDVTNILFGGNANPEKLRVSIVPYVAAVNVGSIATGIVDDTGAAYSATDATKWKGCVSERNYPDDVQDTPPSAGHMWKRYWWTSTKPDPNGDNNWSPINTIFNNAGTCNNSTGPNLACPTPIVPLTNDKTTLLNAITGMQAWCRGGTISHVGMAWGWRTLSPNSPFTDAQPYNTPHWKKAAILMTDGDNLIYHKSGSTFKSDYTALGRLDDNRLGTTNVNTAKTILENRLSEVCTNMKAVGITLYTVTFTSGIGNATKNIYRTCASDASKYFDAPTQADLKTAFHSIGNELSNLRLSK